MNRMEREWAEHRVRYLAAREKSLTADQRKEAQTLMDQLSVDDAVKSAYREIGGNGPGSRNGTWETNSRRTVWNDRDTDYSNPKLVLRSGDSYERFLNAQEGQKYGNDGFDIPAWWRSMAVGNKDTAEFRASMQEGVSADGGYLVPAPVAGQFVDMLRSRIIFMAGAGNLVPWKEGSTLALPIWTADPLIQGVGETVDAYPPASDATVNRALFTARSYVSVETFSWELLQDSAIDVAQVAQDAMGYRLAVQLQNDFIYQTGNAAKITGFTNAAGLLTGVQGGGANGVAPVNWDYVDLAIQVVRSANVEPDLIATSPQAYGKFGRLKNTLNDSIRPSQSVLDYLQAEPADKVIGTTTAISDAETVGTTANCSDIFVMDSSRIYWAIRRDFSVLPLRERFATQRLAGILGFLRIDAILAHPEAAYWLKGALTTGT